MIVAKQTKISKEEGEMSFELTYAKRALQHIENPEIKEVFRHICKAISNLEDENRKLKDEINSVRNRIKY